MSHTSYQGDAAKGITLRWSGHPAVVHISAGSAARVFLAEWFSTNSDKRRDAIAEKYFNSQDRQPDRG